MSHCKKNLIRELEKEMVMLNDREEDIYNYIAGKEKTKTGEVINTFKHLFVSEPDMNISRILHKMRASKHIIKIKVGWWKVNENLEEIEKEQEKRERESQFL